MLAVHPIVVDFGFTIVMFLSFVCVSPVRQLMVLTGEYNAGIFYA